MEPRTTFMLSERAIKRIADLQQHYRTTHGLDLSASAVVRRAVDSLYMELKLVPTPAEERIIREAEAAIDSGKVPPDLDKTVDVLLRYGGPPDPADMKRHADAFHAMMRGGKLPKVETDGPSK